MKMKKSIWKYPLQTVDDQHIVLPSGARLLTVQVQDDNPCIWAEVDADQFGRERHHVRIYGTGHWLEDDPGAYVGSYQLMGGRLVFHVYQQKVETVR